MRCLSCMTVNPTGNRFCENCGVQLELACSKCGHDVAPSARYCGNCGCAVAKSVAHSLAESAPKWGELKQATVLFADIVGSTELIATLDPEEAMGRLRPAVLRMRHSVERFGGTVIRTLGDGVMALFGVPRTLEGHALLACQAALHMQKAFKQDVQGLSIRVGLHSGEIASDPQDVEDGRGGGAHGLTIHLASRVVGVAEPGAICVTQACRALAGPACNTHLLGPHLLKGIRDAVELHVLGGLHLPASGVGARGVPNATFRGRENELAHLAGALEAIEAGPPKVLGVVGEPGGGKSRLCHEFALLCRSRGMPVYEVRAQLYGHALPLQPILELFRTYFFKVSAGDDAATVRGRIKDCFAPLRVSGNDLELLYEFFGVALPGAAQLVLGARGRQARLLGLLKELVRHEPELARLILIEDLHWLDEASEEFVSALVDAVAGTQTLLLLNYRPSYNCPWLRVRHFEQIELHELPGTEMDALVGELMAPMGASPGVVGLVCSRSGGNPFFAEELVRTLAESNLLAADTGLPMGGLEAVERALPATVQAVIGARLDRIGEPEKTLLQMCAIIGKDIPLAVLECVASPLASEIEKGLEGLCQAGLILPQPALAGRRFAFRHPLIQEVAYNSQLKVRRGGIHSKVAAAMELYYADQLDEYAGLVAYHYEAAGRLLDAALYTSRAAKWVGSNNPALAMRHWQKTRALLKHEERSAEVDRLKALAGGRIVYLGWREGLSLEDVNELIAEAQALATDADDRLPQLLLLAQGRMLQASGRPADVYVECLQKALAMEMPSKIAGRPATLNTALSQAYLWSGFLAQGLAASDAAMQGLPEVGAFDREFIGFSVEQWALSIRIRLFNRLGRFDEARACLDAMAAERDSLDDPVLQQIAHYVHVDLAWAMQDASFVGTHAQEVARIARTHPSPYSRVIPLVCQGLAEQTAREFSKAKETFLTTLTLLRQTSVAVDFEAEALASLGECHLQLAEFPQALQAAGEALALSRLRSNRIAECRALLVAGSVLTSNPELDALTRAQDTFADARRLIDLTGARILEPMLSQARSNSLQPARA